MFISDTAIKRPVLTVVAMMMLVVFGVVALFQLDTDEYPEIDAPVVVVAIPYPGRSPDVVEREVIDPVEEAISGISGIDRMRSNSLDRLRQHHRRVRFLQGPAARHAGDSRQDLGDPERPADRDGGADPHAVRSRGSADPLAGADVAGLSGAELTRIVDPGITRKLRGITGVASVNLSGAYRT
jgi:HAE1 family hydrophobic/amphiphilic exporter-1